MAKHSPWESSLERALLTPAAELAVLWPGLGWFHVHDTPELAGVPSRRVATFRPDRAVVAALSVPPREQEHPDLASEVAAFFQGAEHEVVPLGPVDEAHKRAAAVVASLLAGEPYDVPGLGKFSMRRRKVLADLQAKLAPERRFDEKAFVAFRPAASLQERLQR